jgi:hypothetical protein
MICNFSLDNFIISNTRSKSNDTDYVTVSVTVGNNAAITKTQAMGDVGDGTHAVGLAVSANIPTDVPTPVVFSYVIMNNGNGNHAEVQKGVEAALAQLGKEGAAALAKEIAQPIGSAVGAAIGASIGTAVVPLVGTALGALAGWLTSEIGGVLFANCDGIVATGIRAFVSADLLARTNNGGNIREGVQHPGTDSATGCGANSQYATNTTITSMAAITPVFDLNGKYTAGGAPGPIIHLSGNIISVDMSAYHRPSATGTLILPTYGRITFPDDKSVPNGTYDVYFTAPNTVAFQQNKSTWQKTANLEGTLVMSIPANVIAAETETAKASLVAHPPGQASRASS